MTEPMTYERYDPATQSAALTRIMSLAFGGSIEQSGQWLAACPDGIVRVLRDGDRVRAGLALYEMGHWFGGRSVPCRGIAAVGVEPDARGRGVGTRLMIEAVREIHDAGIALSTLYPAAQPIYRRAGYERAGVTCVVEATLATIAPCDRSLALRTATEADEPLFERLESEQARLHDGNVDRSDHMQTRARRPNDKPTEAVVVEEEGRVLAACRDSRSRWRIPWTTGC